MKQKLHIGGRSRRCFLSPYLFAPNQGLKSDTSDGGSIQMASARQERSAAHTNALLHRSYASRRRAGSDSNCLSPLLHARLCILLLMAMI
jgi:hypothetical protein